MTPLNWAHPAPGFTAWPVTPQGAALAVWQRQSRGALGLDPLLSKMCSVKDF